MFKPPHGGMNIMPIEDIPILFQYPAISKNNMAYMQTCEAGERVPFTSGFWNKVR
jgi:hypothetical protein